MAAKCSSAAGDGKAMGLVPDVLQESQREGVAAETQGLSLAGQEYLFLPLGQGQQLSPTYGEVFGGTDEFQGVRRTARSNQQSRDRHEGRALAKGEIVAFLEHGAFRGKADLAEEPDGHACLI